MKTFLKVTVLGLLILLIAGYFVAAYAMGSVVKAGVNRVGPRITQSKVELSGANLSPLTGSGTLTSLAVGNPQGWSENNAFFLGKVSIKLEPRSVFRDTIVIDEIIIEQPEFLYETKFVSSNIKDLLKNIEGYTSTKKEIGADKEEGPPKKFIVKKLRLTNGKATIGLGGTALPVPLPEIALDNLGVAEGGITGSQVAALVMQDVLSKIVAATAGALGQLGGTTGSNSLEKTKEAAEKLGDAVKDIFKKKQ
jgi:hypothetical protein